MIKVHLTYELTKCFNEIKSNYASRLNGRLLVLELKKSLLLKVIIKFEFSKWSSDCEKVSREKVERFGFWNSWFFSLHYPV